MNSHHSGRSRPARPTLRPHPSHKAGDGIAGPHARPLRFEPLEDRRVLAAVVVTTLADNVAPDDGLISLREAVASANSTPNEDLIVFDPQLFSLDAQTIVLKHGQLTITESLTIKGPGRDLLTIDASGNDSTPGLHDGNGTRVFHVATSDSSPVTQIVGLTLTGGDSMQSGGAILALGELSLINVRVTGNSAHAPNSHGGGIAAMNGLQLDRCQVVENRAVAGGGGIFAQRSSTFYESEISKNTAANGAGIEIGASEQSLIESCRITDNRAGGGANTGGGVSSISARLRINNTLIDGNSSTRGGGLFGSVAELARSIVSNNSATFGGGIYTTAGTADEFRVHNSTISGNTAQQRGGGIYTTSGSANATRVQSSTISGNSANDSGGGIWRSDDPQDPLGIIINNCTIANNRADQDGNGTGLGGGVHGRVNLNFSIVADNYLGDRTQFNDVHSPSLALAVASLIGTNVGATLSEAPLGSPDYFGNLIGGPIHGAIDPLLAPLADNGGPTLPSGAVLRTHALLPGSPALDAGDASSIAGIGDKPQFDQRGAPYFRVVDRIDIGAVEQIPQSHVVSTLADESDGDYRLGDLSLREAIELANLQPGHAKITFDPALFASGPATILLTQGELAITESLTLPGPGADLLSIDASGNDPTPNENNGDGAQIFVVSTKSSLTTIEGITLTGGDSPGNGGAIAASSNLRLFQLVMTGNAAGFVGGEGGGVYATGQLSIEECVIANNSAGSGGGGVSAYGNTGITFSTISGNTVAGFNQVGGGGVFVRLGSSFSNITIQYCVISDNRVTGPDRSGGGIRIAGEPTFPASILSSVIANNSASGDGGGVSSSTRQLRILDTLIAGNTAGRGGGGVHGALAEFTRSTAAGNIAEIGGGIYFPDAGSNSLNIKSSTISGNIARDSGGGLWVARSASIQHSTITNNRADSDGDGIGTGGGVHGRAVLEHTILAGNFVGAGAELSDSESAIFAAAFSLIGVNNATGLAEAPLGAPDANGNLIGGPVHGPIDPLLAPLANNGGLLELPTHALLPGSPALDAGDPLATAGGWNTPLFDQRDTPYSRVIGRIDIGAVEQIPETLVVDTLVDESDERYNRGDLSLREAIELANLQPGRQTIQFDPSVFLPRTRPLLITRGEMKITDALDIVGFDRTRIQFSASGSDPTPGADNGDGARIFNIDDGDPSLATHVFIAGVTLSGGDVAADGGAIFSAEPLKLVNLAITGNAARHGGGVYAVAGLELADSVLENNVATGDGAGLAARGDVDVLRTSFISNRGGERGGGLWASGDVSITDATIIRNSTDLAGGGIFIASDSARHPATATIHDSGISDSSAAQGGGVAWDQWSFVSIVNSTIFHNAASSPDQLAPRDGAALYGAGPLVLAHSTVNENGVVDAGPDGAVAVRAGLAFITNSVIANTRITRPDLGLMPGGRATLTYSIVGFADPSSGLAETPAGMTDAQGNRIGGPQGRVNPRLQPNGAPMSGSLTINAGNPSPAALPPELSEFDFRGAPFGRVVNGRIDIGAFEAQFSMGALSADFDASGGRVTGFDFLAWQRGFGLDDGAAFAQGDATLDGDVDANDYAVWKSRFGAVSPPPLPNVAASAPASISILPPPSPEWGGAGGGVNAAQDSAALMSRRAGEQQAPAYAPTARSAYATVRTREFAPTRRDAAFAWANEDPATDEIESSASQESDVNLVIWDEALSRY